MDLFSKFLPTIDNPTGTPGHSIEEPVTHPATQPDNEPDIFDQIIEARQALEIARANPEPPLDNLDESGKWTWTTTSKIRDLYKSVKIPKHIKDQFNDLSVFNWFFTAFTNYVSNFNYKYPGTTFFAEYPVPDQLRHKIAADSILFDMESDGVVYCYL